MILLQAWFNFFAIKNDQPENSNELFQKLLKDLKELAEYKESLEKSSNEIVASNSDQEKEGPPQDSDICQLIREECSTEVCEEQNALNSKLHSINSQRLDKEEQEVKDIIKKLAEHGNRITPILLTREPEYSSSIGYEHHNTTLETESNETIKFGVEELVPILSENEVTLEDKRLCDLPVCENSPICDDHSEIFSDSNNDDHILSNDDDFEDIKYVEALLPDPEIITEEEENVVYQEEEEETRSDNTTTHADDSLPEYDSLCFEIEPDQERDIRFLEALLIDDSIPLSNNESSESNFDNPSVPRPPPEPPDAKTDAGGEISVVTNDRNKFDVSDDYYSFILLIYSRMFISFLSAESGDTIFEPGISI
nr:hypothetical protein [Tanacetum cinerariifolium]